MKLVIVAVAVAVIARARVAVLPGWLVPLPVLGLAAERAGCATFLGWVIYVALREPGPPDAGECPA